ncbi:MAG TPA: hypothetical protein DHV48_03320 [Prolixibacteraceae bacterium]|nr:hypothetical protein [Prolixibacteraceae bacterium]
MPTLSIIQSGNKYAVTYMGEEDEISRMLTQCALRDESLAEAILQSALHINRDRTVAANAQNLGLQPENSNQ